MAALQDPEVQALLPKLMSGDPSVLSQLQGNPKLAKVMSKLSGMFGGAGGPGGAPKPAPGRGAGGFPGGFPGFPGGPGSHNDVD